jgi:hypothetical protein
MAAINEARANQMVENPIVEPIANDLDGHEIQTLKLACKAKHDENGELVSKIITIAILIVSVATILLVKGVVGVISGFTIYFAGGHALHQAYHHFRDNQFLKASKTLDNRAFRNYVVRNRLQLAVDSILRVYQQYRNFAVQAVDHINQRREA